MRKDENSVKKAPQEARDDVMSTKCRTAIALLPFIDNLEVAPF